MNKQYRRKSLRQKTNSEELPTCYNFRCIFHLKGDKCGSTKYKSCEMREEMDKSFNPSKRESE